MGEKGYNPDQNRPKVKMSYEEYKRRLDAQEAKNTPPPQAPAPRQPAPREASQPPQPSHEAPQRPADPNSYPSAQTPEAPAVAPDKQRVVHEIKFPKLSRKQIALGLTAITLVGGGLILAANHFDIQDVFSSMGSGDQSVKGFVMSPNQERGQKSLSLDHEQCLDPEAALLTVVISGDFPIVPMLPDAKHATPGDSPPYMTEENKNKLAADQQDVFAKFITDDGYTHVEVRDLPLSLHVCEPKGSKAIKEANVSEIHRAEPGLRVNFVDPWGEFTSDMPNIKAAYQVSGTDGIDVDPGKGEYMIMPSPDFNYFLGTGKDKVQNKSIAALLATLKTEPVDKSPAAIKAAEEKTKLQQQQFMQVVLAAIETNTIKQLDNVNVTDRPENVSGMTGSLQDTTDNALSQRVFGKSADELIKRNKLSLDGNYSFNMTVPSNPTTKKAITSSNAFPNIDFNQKVNLTSVKIIDGAMTKPTFAPELTSPETPAPSQADK
jgi:hypothetical protein